MGLDSKLSSDTEEPIEKNCKKVPQKIQENFDSGEQQSNSIHHNSSSKRNFCFYTVIYYIYEYSVEFRQFESSFDAEKSYCRKVERQFNFSEKCQMILKLFENDTKSSLKVFSDSDFKYHKEGIKPIVTELISKDDTVKVIGFTKLEKNGVKQIIEVIKGKLEPIILYSDKTMDYSIMIVTVPINAKLAKEICKSILETVEKRTGIRLSCDIFPHYTSRNSALSHGSNDFRLPMCNGELVLKDGTFTDDITRLPIVIHDLGNYKEIFEKRDTALVNAFYPESVKIDFDELPRAMANPIQKIVSSEEVMRKYIQSADGNAPVFTSHNSYVNFLDPKHPTVENVNQINVTKLFFDFDNKEKPENAQDDLIKMLDWCETENLPILPVFSGGKGFHAYLFVKPQIWNAGEALSRIYKAINTWLAQKLRFRTIDMACAEPKRLCRVLYSQYVTKDKKTGEYKLTGTYCHPLTLEQARKMHIDEIKEYARECHKIKYNIKGTLLTLDEFIKRFDIDVDKMLETTKQSESTHICDYNPVDNKEIKELFKEFPCIQNQLVNVRTPRHVARVASTIILRNLGYDRDWILQFWKQRNPLDFNEETTAYQISTLEKYKYQYGCDKLKEGEICIGKDACFKYKLEENLVSVVGKRKADVLAELETKLNDSTEGAEAL